MLFLKKKTNFSGLQINWAITKLYHWEKSNFMEAFISWISYHSKSIGLCCRRSERRNTCMCFVSILIIFFFIHFLHLFWIITSQHLDAFSKFLPTRNKNSESRLGIIKLLWMCECQHQPAAEIVISETNHCTHLKLDSLRGKWLYVPFKFPLKEPTQPHPSTRQLLHLVIIQQDMREKNPVKEHAKLGSCCKLHIYSVNVQRRWIL